MLFKQSEGTAARRKARFFVTDSADGVSGKTGQTFSGSELQVIKAGGAFADFAGSATERSDGVYEYEYTAGELDTVGDVGLKVEKSGCVTRHFEMGTVVAFDPYDAVHFGLSALPNAAAAAAGGLPTVGTGSGQINPSSGNVTVAGYAAGQAPLQPTVAGRTLDVSAGGAAGVDLANVEGQTTVLNLTNTTIKDVTDVESAIVGLLANMTIFFQRVLGLQHENSMLDNTTHSSGKMTAGRLRVFEDEVALAAATPGAPDDSDGEIKRYLITGTYVGDDLATWQIATDL